MAADAWYYSAGQVVLRLITFYASRVLVEVCLLLVQEIFVGKPDEHSEADLQRRRTLLPVMMELFRYSIYFMALIMSLKEASIDPTPLLAGAGVLGVAIGFGAQTFVGDIVAGFFILLEDLVLVGDLVEISGIKGLVEEIGVQITRIRDDNGVRHAFWLAKRPVPPIVCGKVVGTSAFISSTSACSRASTRASLPSVPRRMAFAGLRPNEVRAQRCRDLTLRRKDGEVVGGFLSIREGCSFGETDTPKTGPREVPIALALARLLAPIADGPRDRHLLQTHKGEPWGQYGLAQAFDRARNKAGLSGWSVYSLRHYAITAWLRRGIPVHVVQKMAGHKHLAMTQRYVHFLKADLEAAAERLAEFGNSLVTPPSPPRGGRKSKV